MLLTSSYILYKKYYLINDLKTMSQHKCHYQVTLAWIDCQAHWSRNISMRRELIPSGSNISTTRSQASGQTKNNRNLKGVTDRSLDPTTVLHKILLTQ